MSGILVSKAGHLIFVLIISIVIIIITIVFHVTSSTNQVTKWISVQLSKCLLLIPLSLSVLSSIFATPFHAICDTLISLLRVGTSIGIVRPSLRANLHIKELFRRSLHLVLFATQTHRNLHPVPLPSKFWGQLDTENWNLLAWSRTKFPLRPS